MINKLLGLVGEQAGDGMTLTALDELGSGGRGAVVLRLPTAGAEVAARRWIDRVGELAGEHDALPGALELRVGHRRRREQRLRVRVQRRSEELFGGRGLHDAAEVHHRHPVGEVTDDGEVVRDEEVGEPELRLELARAG